MIGIIINFCSNEIQFLNSLLYQCSIITDHIVVSYGSHMYDGSKEHLDDILQFYKYKYPHVNFIKYNVDISAQNLKGVVKRPTAYWCNLARWQGIQSLIDKTDWFLFLDADEIPEGNIFKRWIDTNTLDEKYIYKFANYWYFKDVVNQATTFEDSILFVHKKYLTEDAVFHDDERDGIIKMSKALQNRMITYQNKPMFHHFSWVRQKDGLAKKLRTWAHRDDIFKNADVESIIEYIYKNDDVNDIVHNYTYIKVDNQFNISL